MSHHQISEHEIQSTIIEWLKIKRFFFWRNNVGGFVGVYKGKRRFVHFGMKGSPDIYVLRKGQLIGIEVKSESKNQSRDQIEFQTQFEHAGGQYFVAYKLSDVEAVLGNGSKI